MFLGQVRLAPGSGLGQAEDPEVIRLRDQEQRLREICRQKRRNAEAWAAYAKDYPEYADVAADAQSETEECFEDANALRRRIAALVAQKLGPTGMAPMEEEGETALGRRFPVVNLRR